MFPRRTFRTINAGVLVVFALAIAAVGLSIWHDRTEAIAGGVRDARNIATLLGGQIARSIQSVDIILSGLRSHIDTLDIAETSGLLHLPKARAFQDVMRQRLATLPQAFQAAMADNRGQLVLSTAAWPTPDINVADREYFQELAANDDDRLSISLPFDNRVTGEPTLVLARRISGPDGAFLGIIFISVKRSYFESIYRAIDSLPDQTFLLLRHDGTVVILYPHGQTDTGRKIAVKQPYFSAVANGGGSYRVVSAFDGKTRWAAVYPLQDYQLVVNSGISEEALLREWRQRASLTIIATLVILAGALFLLLIMARQYRRLSASEASLAEKSAALDREHQALEHEHAQLLEREAELRRNETELRTQNQRFDAALNNMNQGLAMFDHDTRLVVSNERFRQMLRLSPEQARPGLSLRQIVEHTHRCRGFPDNVDGFLAEIFANLPARKPFSYEVQDVDARIISVKNEPMPGRGYVATFEDVTDRRAGEAKINRLAHNDLLTGVANRQQFQDQIDKARERLHDSGQPFTVLMLDLDRFKHVNDSLGHAAGDSLLKQTARRLEASLRAADVLARLGGDEFAIIQTPPRDFKSVDEALPIMRESAMALASRIIELISQPFDFEGHKMVVGTSIGIAMAPVDGTEPDELMKKADLALYKTKSDGRNAYTFFDRTLAAVADERHRLEMDLREGLSRDEFELYYQPMIDVATGGVIGMEALPRWHHPAQGLIMPDRFIPLCEDTGLITSFGEWILQSACTEAATWPPHVKVAINISAVQFRKTNLLDVILCTLVDTGLPPERLEIEITERVLLEKDADHLSTLQQLKNIGVSIVLDDFGTGNSSFGYLEMFPFDKIKIDQSFTRQLLERSECAAITCAVINLGRSLDILTVAEGVETQAQFQALRAAGATQVQGYLFGRPQPAAQLAFAPTDDAVVGEPAMAQA